MKRLILIASVITLTGRLCWAETAETATPKFAKEGPCKEILQACQAAGYYKGGYKVGKGEYVNCMDPILKGGSVAGVSVTPDKVSACNANRAKHEGRKAAGGTAAPAATTPPPAPAH